MGIKRQGKEKKKSARVMDNLYPQMTITAAKTRKIKNNEEKYE